MKLSRAPLLIVLLALVPTSGCSLINRIRAKNQLNEGARSYRASHFADAQEHFEKALELDPSQKNAPFFIARAIHAQYKPGVDTPANVAKANAAIDAYKNVLQHDPGNDEAYNAVAYLYGALKEDDKQRDWIQERANLEDTPAAKRSDAYTVLASKDWTCSNNITEQKENQKTVTKGTKIVIEYQKPKDPQEYQKALGCSTEGLQLVEKALSLNNNSEQAWSYKTNLLREMAKLSSMDGKPDQAADYTKQANEAEQQTKVLSDENKRKKEAAEAAASPPPAS